MCNAFIISSIIVVVVVKITLNKNFIQLVLKIT